MLNEMIEFPGGVYGPGAEPRGDGSRRHPPRRCTKHQGRRRVQNHRQAASVPVGKGLLGRVVNALGRTAGRQGRGQERSVLSGGEDRSGHHHAQVGVVPVQTGIMAIDAMIPIGRGQRELIIGDRATGKTTMAHRHHHLPGAAEQGRRGRQAQGPQAALLHLRRHRPEAVQRGARHRDPGGSRRHGIHDRRRRLGLRYGDEPVSGALFAGCAMGEWFMDQGHGCADRL